MNFFEEQLRFIIGNQSAFENAKYIGRACIASLDNGIKLKAEFITRNMADRYEALKLTVINPTDGETDSLLLHFNDYFNDNKIDGIAATPYIWKYDGKTKWYTEPSIAEKAALGDAVQNYAELFIPQNEVENSKMSPARSAELFVKTIDFLDEHFTDARVFYKILRDELGMTNAEIEAENYDLRDFYNEQETTVSSISSLPKLGELLGIRFEDVHLVHKDEEHDLATIVELDKNTLTEQGKEAWSDVLNSDVYRIYEGNYGLQIEVDGVTAERICNFSYMLAGHCASNDYDKWVNDAPDSQDINLNM